MKSVNVGMIGLGTVGRGVADTLGENAETIARRVRVPIRLLRVADRSAAKKGLPGYPSGTLVSDPRAVLDDPSIHIVVELIGGEEPARSYILRALEAGKHVVTANKALLAECGETIFEAAARAGCALGFEASVGGGIPIVRAIREGLAANRVEAIYGIVNGTCNYILSQMTERGAAFEEVLAEAQRRGYAEAEPSLDVDGTDSAHKIAILANLAYGTPVRMEDILVEGIRHITPSDIRYAGELGFRVKLLGLAHCAEGELDIRVHPTMIPEAHPLAKVEGVYNAIYVKGDRAGANIFIGRGAGAGPTASAVVSDIVELARETSAAGRGGRGRVPPAAFRPDARWPLPVKQAPDILSCYYLRFMALDRPGVLSKISGVLGRHNISIESVIQKGRSHEGDYVPLVLMTHEALEHNMRKALLEISRLDVVGPEWAMIRVVGDTDFAD
ncbi:MAG: homoserine dehydrogenase [Nitrospinota bacterium]